MRTISTYRKSGRLFILRVMAIYRQLPLWVERYVWTAETLAQSFIGGATPQIPLDALTAPERSWPDIAPVFDTR